MTMTKAEEWKNKAAVIDLLLPSGITIKVRQRNVNALLVGGLLPYSLAEKISGGEGVDLTSVEREAIYSATKRIVSLVCSASVDPVIVMENPKEGEIEISEIPQDDITYLRSWITGTASPVEVAALETFPPVATV
jgi:hypothetical protein